MNFNKVMLAGNLTRDPELKTLQSGLCIAAFGMAVNRRWKSAEGEQKEEVTFIDCTAFGKTAEVIAQYFAKGKPIFIEGRLNLEQWEDKEGQKRSKLKVVVESFQFVGSKSDGEAAGRSAAPSAGRASESRSAAPARPGTAPTRSAPAPEDDIPF